MPWSVILVLISFVVMGLAWLWRFRPAVHVPLMAAVMLFDLAFPVWLSLTHGWYRRLIEQGELFSFLIWAHLMWDLILYALYVMQIREGRRLLAASAPNARANHRMQARAIVAVRLLVFLTGALLIAPESPSAG